MFKYHLILNLLRSILVKAFWKRSYDKNFRLPFYCKGASQFKGAVARYVLGLHAYALLLRSVCRLVACSLVRTKVAIITMMYSETIFRTSVHRPATLVHHETLCIVTGEWWLAQRRRALDWHIATNTNTRDKIVTSSFVRRSHACVHSVKKPLQIGPKPPYNQTSSVCNFISALSNKNSWRNSDEVHCELNRSISLYQPIQRYHRRPSATYRLATIQNVTDRQTTNGQNIVP